MQSSERILITPMELLNLNEQLSVLNVAWKSELSECTVNEGVEEQLEVFWDMARVYGTRIVDTIKQFGWSGLGCPELEGYSQESDSHFLFDALYFGNLEFWDTLAGLASGDDTEQFFDLIKFSIGFRNGIGDDSNFSSFINRSLNSSLPLREEYLAPHIERETRKWLDHGNSIKFGPFMNAA